jgi:adenylate cyclase
VPKKSAERRLAAILAADVVGFSRLMEQDEAGTMERMRGRRQNVLMPLVARYGGRVFKLMGDGVLIEFASVVNAVGCAVDLQQAMRAQNVGMPSQQQLLLRIGINLGDVIVEGSDLYGNGVNLASRLEALSEPGGICVSGDVYRHVRGMLHLDFQDIGEQKVKNIAEPMHAYRIQARNEPNDVESTDVARPTIVPPKKLSIAVLPFTNISGDKEQEYFADGISEEIITALSKLSQLFVVDRNSSFTFKGKNVPVQEVSNNLGVRYVLEGSVRKSGNKLRITSRLVDGVTGGHLWAERFDRDLTEIFVVQDDVTQHIVAALALNLTETEQQHFVGEHTDNLEAYDYFLRGREQWWRYTKEPNLQAQELLRRAIELDPNFSPPYAFLAVVYVHDYVNQWSGSPSCTLEQAHELASRAVLLADNYPYAHWALAAAYVWMRRHEDAISEAERAISLNSNFSRGHIMLGFVLHYAGRSEEALRCFDRGMALDPYYPDMYLHFQAQAHFQLGRYETAIGILKRRLLRNPETDISRVLLAASYGHVGRIEEARAEWLDVFRVNPDYSLEHRRKVLPYKNPADFELVVDGLRKAGLVE